MPSLENTEEYETATACIKEKHVILTKKEDNIALLKNTIVNLNLELAKLQEKRGAITFLLQSSIHEQSQIKTALGRDKYNDSLREKLNGVNLDLKQYFQQELAFTDRIEALFVEMVEKKREMKAQYQYMGHLMEEIHQQNVRVIQARRKVVENC